QDLGAIGSHLSSSAQWRSQWARLRSLPAWYFRFQLMNYLAPGWLDTRLRQDGAWFDLDDDGWLPLMAADEESVASRRELAHAQYTPALHNFEVSAAADGALRALIERARRNGAGVALYLMPEGDVFRSWYPADARTKLAAYLACLTREQRVVLFDATQWCSESDFADSHHLRSAAATRFSQRFGREIAGPFVTHRTAEAAEKSPIRHSSAHRR
ncbi:MAG: hypothetical protein ACREHD_06320, partial [Pirellulales bacterium]